MYLTEVYISEEDAPRLLLKHRFIKVKRHWELPNSPNIKFSTQEALQALVLHIVTIELEGKKKIKVNTLNPT